MDMQGRARLVAVAHTCGRVAHVFRRCSVFPGVSVLVLLRFYFLSRPSRPCCCLPAEGAYGCLIGLSFQYWVGPPPPPLVLEPLLSASAQSPCILLLLLRCDVQAATARPSQLSSFRQRFQGLGKQTIFPEVARVMRQSRAERCISVDCQVTPLSSSFFPPI